MLSVLVSLCTIEIGEDLFWSTKAEYTGRIVDLDTHDLNFTVDVRYWNKIRHCTNTLRRKFASDNCKAKSFGLVRNFAKKWFASSVCSSMAAALPSLNFVDETELRCSSNLKLLNADSTLVICWKYS